MWEILELCRVQKDRSLQVNKTALRSSWQSKDLECSHHAVRYRFPCKAASEVLVACGSLGESPRVKSVLVLVFDTALIAERFRDAEYWAFLEVGLRGV